MCKIRPLLGLFVMMIALTAVPILHAQTPTNNNNFSLQAISPDGKSIIPYFVLDGTSGGQITGQVQIVNRGDIIQLHLITFKLKTPYWIVFAVIA